MTMQWNQTEGIAAIFYCSVPFFRVMTFQQAAAVYFGRKEDGLEALKKRSRAPSYFGLDNSPPTGFTFSFAKQLSTPEAKLEKLRNSNLEMYNKKLCADFTVVCSDGDQKLRFSCHKSFLANGSQHFFRMFSSGMKEVVQDEVVVQDYNMITVESFVKYFYIKEIDSKVCSSQKQDTILSMVKILHHFLFMLSCSGHEGKC